jgi:halocyanin-like protein
MDGNTEQLRRRVFMASVTAGLTALAGCQDIEGTIRLDVEKNREEWLEGIETYDGTILDWTGRETVEVENGAGPNGWYFDPPAIRVDTGTTVVWTWTADSARHNVIHANEKGQEKFFKSELSAADTKEFRYTFETPGEHRYYCGPHEALNSRGLVIVEETTGAGTNRRGGGSDGRGDGGSSNDGY